MSPGNMLKMRLLKMGGACNPLQTRKEAVANIYLQRTCSVANLRLQIHFATDYQLQMNLQWIFRCNFATTNPLQIPLQICNGLSVENFEFATEIMLKIQNFPLFLLFSFSQLQIQNFHI